jgi:ParB family chromosome partitioning protein
VRETEALVRRLVAGPPKPRAETAPDVHTRAAQDELSKALGARVRIVRTRKGGTIVIPFTSEDELQRLYEIITGRP